MMPPNGSDRSRVPTKAGARVMLAPTDAAVPAPLTALAAWSPWLPFTAAVVQEAPQLPGVYLFSTQNRLVYVGMAGERSGKGLRGRLRIYVSGRAPHSGLGNLALERALADPAWLEQRTTEVEQGSPRTVQEWSRLAVQRADLSVAWATTPTPAHASALEAAVLEALDGDDHLWNRRRPTSRSGRATS